MLLCPSCNRHHRESEARCPFCGRRRARRIDRALAVGISAIVLAACYGAGPMDDTWTYDGGGTDGGSDCTDGDGDSYCAEVDDCDDGDAAINPAATEVCDDGKDNDCDGDTDADDGDCAG